MIKTIDANKTSNTRNIVHNFKRLSIQTENILGDNFPTWRTPLIAIKGVNPGGWGDVSPHPCFDMGGG